MPATPLAAPPATLAATLPATLAALPSEPATAAMPIPQVASQLTTPQAAGQAAGQETRAQLLARIEVMRRDYRALMADCIRFGRGDPDQFIDKGIPQSELFMSELLPFIYRAYIGIPTNALKTVLDIGPQSFGGTRLLHDLHSPASYNKLKLAITAVDIVKSFELLQKLMVPGVEFLIQDIFSIEGRAWDFVLCSHVVEHVPDPLPFLARCQALAHDFVLVACPWEELPITTKGHVNTITPALVAAAGGEELTVYTNYMWGKKRQVCIFRLPGKAPRPGLVQGMVSGMGLMRG